MTNGNSPINRAQASRRFVLATFGRPVTLRSGFVRSQAEALTIFVRGESDSQPRPWGNRSEALRLEGRIAFRRFAFFVAVLPVIILVAIGNYGYGFIAAAIAFGALISWRKASADLLDKVTPVHYEFTPRAEQQYRNLMIGFDWASSSNSFFAVDGESARSRVRAITRPTQPPLTVVDVYASEVALDSSKTLSFLPDRVLLVTNQKTSEFFYSDLDVRFDTVPTPEPGGSPRDATVSGYTWTYTRRDGQPDKRYKNNPRIPLVDYGSIRLSVPGAFMIHLFLSSQEAAKHLATSIQSYSVFCGRSREVVESRQSRLTVSARQAAEATPKFTVTVTPGRFGGDSVPLEHDPNPFWKPPGSRSTIQEFTIDEGLIYVGKNLRAHAWSSVDPALINPTLQIRSGTPGKLNYWPSYADLDPVQRHRYLWFLSSGRSDPHTPIGYVFLYFYGLERRAVADPRKTDAARADRPIIRAEVARLRQIYGDNNSFASYSSNLLDLLDVLDSATRTYEQTPPAEFPPSYELPMSLRLSLGQLARDGRPLPADWALTWLRADPESRLRTPATRCAAEFAELFVSRYRNAYSDGLVLPDARKKLKLEYRAASNATGTIPVEIGDLPDVTSLTAPQKRLREIAESCMIDLDAYSRWLGRNPGGQNNPAAVALLPADLGRRHSNEAAHRLREFLTGRIDGQDSDAEAFVSVDELCMFWPVENPARITKKDAVMLAQAIERFGLGIEPDVRFGGPVFKLGDRLALFREPEVSAAPTGEYAVATLLAHFAVAVSAADGHVSPDEYLPTVAHAAETLGLTAGECARLFAHTRWLAQTNPGTSGLKKRIDQLTEGQRKQIADLAITVATADGHIASAEVEMLRRMFKLLRLDESTLYTDLHASAAERPTGPVTLLPADCRPSGYKIPTLTPSPAVKGFSIDMATVQQKIADTAAVSALLGDIFAEDDPPAAMSAAAVPAARISIFDPKHTSFLERLRHRQAWERAELELIAAELSLMLDGAIEVINDAAFAACDEPLLEGDDMIEINAHALSEMMGSQQ
jgi:uncharacterized tellurite resistance protein B-like protein